MFLFQSPILEPAMTSYSVGETQETRKWPQYVAALSATGGALAAGLFTMQSTLAAILIHFNFRCRSRLDIASKSKTSKWH